MNIIKNPIVLGVIGGGITYLYLYLTRDKKKDPTGRDISLIYPLIIFILVAVLAYIYFNYYSSDGLRTFIEPNNKMEMDKYNLAKDISSESVGSFHLISRKGGISIPNEIKDLPNVFIETYD